MNTLFSLLAILVIASGLVGAGLTIPNIADAKGKCEGAKECKIIGKNIKLEDVDDVTIVIPNSGQAFNDSGIKNDIAKLQGDVSSLSLALGNLSSSAITSLEVLGSNGTAPQVNDTNTNNTGNVTG